MKNWLHWIWLMALLACPIVFWALPASFFDSTGVTLCFSKWLFNVECMGCGMTRAVMYFHHFDFEKALGFNRGVVVVYPLLVLLWIYWVEKAASGVMFRTLKLFKRTPKKS